MSQPHGSFASAFREHVIPLLEREIARLATDMADDTLNFSEAMAELMHVAHRRGAGRLPDPVHDDLHEWLAVGLLDEATLADDAYALILGLLREPSRDVLRQAVRAFLNDNAMEFGNE